MWTSSPSSLHRAGHSQRGATLLDVAVALAVGVLLLVTSLRAIAALRHAERVTAQAARDRETLAALCERWRTEATGAWAIFVPPLDVLGTANGDGHEVDFFTEDARHRPIFWAYRYDAPTATLQRYAYGSPGGTPIVAGLPLARITAFSAYTGDAAELRDPHGPLFDPLFANALIPRVREEFGFGSAVAGGNPLTVIRIATRSSVRIVMLASGSAPGDVTAIFPYTPPP